MPDAKLCWLSIPKGGVNAPEAVYLAKKEAALSGTSKMLPEHNTFCTFCAWLHLHSDSYVIHQRWNVVSASFLFFVSLILMFSNFAHC